MDSEPTPPDTLQAVTPETRLADFPDWRYFLREIYQLYRFSSAGGSARIRSHQKEVRHRLSRMLERDPPAAFGEHVTKPVCAHLPRALDRGLTQPTEALVRSIERVDHQLQWEYGYDRMPGRLGHRYAFAQFVSPRGPIVADDLILGLVLFAPGTTYPTHSHDGITESYICLSGALSENDVGVYAPGSLILNPPGHAHRITTGDLDPCLLVYAWTGTPERLANQKMVFSRPKKGA